MNLDVLLSDQFIDFSEKIKDIAVSKKKLKADFKVAYDNYQAEIKSLDELALETQQQFEDWKKELEENVGDG